MSGEKVSVLEMRWHEIIQKVITLMSISDWL